MMTPGDRAKLETEQRELMRNMRSLRDSDKPAARRRIVEIERMIYRVSSGRQAKASRRRHFLS
jgi:hypothetical protein